MEHFIGEESFKTGLAKGGRGLYDVGFSNGK